MKTLIVAVTALLLASAVEGAELSTTNDSEHRYGWQDRGRVCASLTSEQCEKVLMLQLGTGGDGGATGGAGADAGDSGSTGGTTGPR